MIFSQEELQSWVTKNMPTLLRQGLLFNRAVYNEMFLALDASRDDLVAIIPADADNAEDLIHQIFYMKESSQHTTVRCRQLFEGIEVLLANSGFSTGSSSYREQDLSVQEASCLEGSYSCMGQYISLGSCQCGNQA